MKKPKKPSRNHPASSLICAGESKCGLGTRIQVYGGRPGPKMISVRDGDTTSDVAVAETLFSGEVETDAILICRLADGRFYLCNDGDEDIFPTRLALAAGSTIQAGRLSAGSVAADAVADETVSRELLCAEKNFVKGGNSDCRPAYSAHHVSLRFTDESAFRSAVRSSVTNPAISYSTCQSRQVIEAALKAGGEGDAC